jgi:hypothetical protein
MELSSTFCPGAEKDT